MTRLLDDTALEASSVVAHRFMNRERELRGANGYAREIGLDPVELLEERLASRERARWLDLCCGTGRALIQAAQHFMSRGLGDRVSITGVDLVDAFSRETRPPCLSLLEASLHRYETTEPHDLVTCVHGLHYIGDKLDLIARACRWLGEDGVFVATFDVRTLRLASGASERQIPGALRKQGLTVDLRRHVVRCEGHKTVTIPWSYRGADERGGASFTGEPAVISHYE